MNDIASFSPFRITNRDFIKKFCSPHLKISCRFRVTIHLEAWGQDLQYNVLVWIKKISPIKFIVCVGFSAFFVAGINLAKNWCAMLIFFQIGDDILKWEQNFFFDFKLALLSKASKKYKLNYPPKCVGVDCNLSLFKLSTSDKFLRQK